MLRLLAWLHGLLLRACWWLLKLPVMAVWATLLAVLALLGEEARRWAGIIVSGLLIFGAGKATMSYAPDGVKRPLVMAVLLLVMIWGFAAHRALRFTAHNNLIAVRQRRAFRELKGDVRDLRGEVVEGMARRTRGTRAGRMFKSNRDADAKAEVRAQEAERRAEAEREAAEAEERRTLAERAAGFDPYETLSS